jgi:DNA-directed RNA polymerase subunit H (RpoH/RPB5)
MEKIYTSFNIIMEMLHNRGINVPDIRAGQIDSFIASQANKPGFEIVIGNIRLVYYLSNKFKWSELKKFFEDESSYDLTIIIVKDKISQNNMKQLSALNIEMQTFLLKELQFNISKHVLIPKHELIKDPQEVKKIMEMYSLKNKHQFPIILKTDPMAKWLNLKSGDIIRITRPSPTSGHYIVYRCCL